MYYAENLELSVIYIKDQCSQTHCENPEKNRNKVNLPWFSENLWQLMKSRDAALKKAIKTKRDTDTLDYKGLRNKVFKELRLAKSRFHLQLLSEAKGNSKEIWKSINNLRGRAQHHSRDIQLTIQGKIVDDVAISGAGLRPRHSQ